MNQHSIQGAYFKSFRNADGKVWVYPKEGGDRFQKPTSWCTAENDFQSEALERAQANIIELPGIKALRSLLSPSGLSELEYDLLSQWSALHILRNQRMRSALKEAGKDYEKEFPNEFEMELLFSKGYYTHAKVYTCSGSNFFVTSDDPVVEFSCSDHCVRFFVVSPQKLVQLSSRDGMFSHEQECFEDVVNSMILSKAFKHIYSHRDDVDINKYKRIADKWGMIPRLETQKVLIKNYAGGLPSRFP